MLSYNCEKAPLYDTIVINTLLYDSRVHETLYQLLLYHIMVLFQRYMSDSMLSNIIEKALVYDTMVIDTS